MDLSIIQIEIAVAMVGASIVLFMWLQGSMTADSIGRLGRMIARVGLDPKVAARDDPQTVNLMKDARQRCARCPSEARCERWLAGEIGGGNTFCANARVFDELAGTG